MSKRVVNFFIGTSLLILIWQCIIWTGQFNEALFPGPLTVFFALINLTQEGILFIHIKDSLFRFAIGFTFAAITAITLGLIFGRSKWLWQIIDPVIQLLRPISPVAWSPFIVLAFGIGNIPAIVIIFIAAFFPTLLSTVKGVKSIEPHYLHLADNLQFSSISLYKKIIIPASLPSIMGGLHLALGTAWVFLVAGEMVGSQSGLGYLIVDARNMLNLANVLAGIVVIGLCGFLLDRTITLIQFAFKRFYRLHL